MNTCSRVAVVKFITETLGEPWRHKLADNIMVSYDTRCVSIAELTVVSWFPGEEARRNACKLRFESLRKFCSRVGAIRHEQHLLAFDVCMWTARRA